MKVVKFGGTSLADANQIKKVCSIIVSDPLRKIIVVSAPGKRSKDDIKVTDLLINCANSLLSNKPYNDIFNTIIDRYKSIATDLNLSADIIARIKTDLENRLETNLSKEKFLDLIKAAGEDNCAKLVAEHLKNIGINARYTDPKDAGLLLSNDSGNAHVLPEAYTNLEKLSKSDELIIFPGFFGYSKNGDVITFPRGGSDITGSILAASVNADLYENFTDVDSVFAANPNIINNPKPIHELTYREMRELAYAGFSVLHEDTLEPVYKKGIPVYIKNTNNPNSTGTLISKKRELTGNLVSGIAGDKGFCCINISKYLMNKEVGFGRKLLGILEEEHISFEHIPSGIDNMSVILREKDFNKAEEKKVIQKIKDLLSVDTINVDYNLAIIMLVGEGMFHSIGTSSRATTALAKASINIEMINQGSSEVSMMFGVKADDSEKAVKVLYTEFFE